MLGAEMTLSLTRLDLALYRFSYRGEARKGFVLSFIYTYPYPYPLIEDLEEKEKEKEKEKEGRMIKSSKAIPYIPSFCLFPLSHSLPTTRCRAPWRTQFQGSRPLHLLHTLFTTRTDPVSRKRLATIREKKYTDASEVSLTLVDEDSDEGTTMTLSQALQRLKPLSYLVGVENRPGVYRIENLFHLEPSKLIVQHFKRKSYAPWSRGGRGKEVHITTSCTREHLRDRLSISYKQILEGSRLEFHLRQNLQPTSSPTVDWALERCLHLRPESILAAMPEGTTMLCKPATTDMSVGFKVPRNLHNAQTQVMWIMENGDVLESAQAQTPPRIKKLADWSRRTNRVKGVSEGVFASEDAC